MIEILLTNDDGIDSPGLVALRRALDGLGSVTTVAPDGNRSAIARSITIERRLTGREVTFGHGYRGIALDGTPVDCVHAAMLGLFGPQPDLVLSGVNLGANMGEDVTYSGTVGAAFEGALIGLPAVAVSIEGRTPAHLDEMVPLALPIVVRVAREGLPRGIMLNVNLPDCERREVRGVEVTRLGCASYHGRIEVESDGRRGEHRYRVLSELRECENEAGTDFAAIAHYVVSVTPLRTDWRDEPTARLLETWDLEGMLLAGRHAGDAAGGS